MRLVVQKLVPSLVPIQPGISEFAHYPNWRIYDQLDMLDNALLEQLASLFAAESPAIDSLKIYLLKEIRQRSSLGEIKQKCDEMSAMNKAFSWAGTYPRSMHIMSNILFQENSSGALLGCLDCQPILLHYMSIILRQLRP